MRIAAFTGQSLWIREDQKAKVSDITAAPRVKKPVQQKNFMLYTDSVNFLSNQATTKLVKIKFLLFMKFAFVFEIIILLSLQLHKEFFIFIRKANNLY